MLKDRYGNSVSTGSTAALEKYNQALDLIHLYRGVAQRFGGSHAQRDILTLTALHAALRGNLRTDAEALTAERLAHKPHSPWAGRLALQARKIGAAQAA